MQNLQGAQTYMGLHIHVTTDKPKQQLAEDVPVSPEFRKDINAWMIDFFGVWNIVEDGQVFNVGSGAIFMNPRTYAKFLKALEAENAQKRS